MPNQPARLTPREQYALAYRFLRCRLAMDLNPTGQENVYRSFGISRAAYEAAWGSMGWSMIDFDGWRNHPRMWEFVEVRGTL